MPTQGNNYTVDRRGVSPETLSVVSARNRIFAVPAWEETDTQYQIGVVANFSPSEGRTIEPVRGIGYGDRIMELVPGMTDAMTVSVSRTAQYLSQIMQVFGYKGGIDGICRSLRHHKYPFDMRQELIIGALANETAVQSQVGETIQDPSAVIPDAENTDITPTGQSLQALLTIYEACWMSDWSVAYSSDTALVQEDVTINVTDVIASDDAADRATESGDLFNLNALSSLIKGVATA